jgi:hypothetical protein
MEEEKMEIENTPDPEGEKKEVHYHYHMDETRGPQSPGPYQSKPGEEHYHYYYEPPKMKKPRSAKPTVAGVLLLLHALFSIAMVALLIWAGLFIADPAGGFAFFGEEENGDISGTVTFLNGTAVEGATVSVSGTQLSTQTDENGDYLIYNVPSGNRRISVELAGYNTIVLKTFVNSENINMNMDPNDPDPQSNENDFVLTVGSETIEKGNYTPVDFIKNLVIVCAVVLVILSVIALLGAYASFKRENFKLALAGAIAGTVSLGLFAFIALFILILAKDEFKDPKKDTNQMGPLGGESS